MKSLVNKFELDMENEDLNFKFGKDTGSSLDDCQVGSPFKRLKLEKC